MNCSNSQGDVSSEVIYTLEEWAAAQGLNTKELKEKFIGLSPSDKRVIANILDRDMIACYMKRVEDAWSIRLTPGANSYFKSDEKAKEFRLQGDKDFTAKRYQDALLAYTQALRFASFERTVSPEGNEFVLAYSARSALYFNCEQWSLALSDIKMALKYGCSSVELEERKKQCEAELLKETDQPPGSALDDSQEKEMAEALAELKVDAMLSSSSFIPQLSDSASAIASGGLEMEEVEPIIEQPNPKMPAVSIKAVETSYETKGRGLKTIEKVAFGEVLAKESPYAHTLFIDCFDDYCQACCKPLEGHTVPCPGCSIVQYCSRECKKADKVHWKYTCHPQLPHIYDPLIQLMLRIVCRSFMPEMKSPSSSPSSSSSSSSSSSPPESSPPSETESIFLTNYSSFRKLCYPPLACQDYILLSIYVGLCVRKMFYSLKNNQGVIIPKLGGLIAHIFLHYHRLSINKIFIISQEEPIRLTTSPTTIYETGDKIGLAIYPTMALLNHACLSSTFLFFSGPQAVIRASRNLGPDQELTICYGPSYASDTYSDRQRKLLDGYYFNCQCDQCAAKATSPRICYRCPKCPKPLIVNQDETHYCSQCDATNVIKPETVKLISETLEKLEIGRTHFEAGDLDSAITILSKSYNTLDDHLYRSNCNLIKARCYLSECLAAMGHYRMASKLIAVNVNVTGDIYGCESVEYVCIVITYLNLMCKDVEDIWDDEDREQVKTKGAQTICLVDEQIERLKRITKLFGPNANPFKIFNQEMKSLEGIKEQTQRIMNLAAQNPE